MASEKLMECPYDKNHQIRPSRFPYHLVKCKQNNMKIAKELLTCPYNARHRIPKHEFNFHVANCENKVLPVTCEVVATVLQNEVKEVGACHAPPSKEDWEADVENSPVPFIFGTRTHGQIHNYQF